MREAIIGLFMALLVFFSGKADAQVFPEHIVQHGRQFTRLVNMTDYTVSCYFRDQHSLYTFLIYPRSAGPWYSLYGGYVWECN